MSPIPPPTDSASNARAATSRWSQLPVFDPPAHLRAAVLAQLDRSPRHSSHALPAFAAAAVAALFVMALALPALRPGAPSSDAPARTALRAQGIEVEPALLSTQPARIVSVAADCAASRLGVLPGDRLLAIDAEAAHAPMLNVTVWRGGVMRHVALPRTRPRVGDSGAGMAARATIAPQPASSPTLLS